MLTVKNLSLLRINHRSNIYQYVFKQHKIIRAKKIMKSLKNHRGKMSAHVNILMSKIMCMPIKIGICTYTTYTNCQPLLPLEETDFLLFTFVLKKLCFSIFHTNYLINISPYLRALANLGCQ